MRRFGVCGGGLLGAALLIGTMGCAMFAPAKTTDEDARKATSHLEIGSDHMANDRTALALREFMAAEQFDPRNAKVQYALGEAYLARGKREDSERHLRRALQLFPDYHDARLSLAGLLLLEKRYPDAIAECDVLIEDPTYPSPWSALTNRAWAEFKLGDPQQALETLELADEYRSGYWPSMLARASIESEAGHKHEAIRLYQDILSQGPGAGIEAEVNYRIAEIYVALGKRREALGHLTTSVARAPESPWAKKSQEYLKRLY